MRLINLLLNLACALLWINWRSVRLAAAERSSPLSLAAALKKTDSRKAGRWLSLAAILAVLFLRAVFYWNVGTVTHWTPTLELGVITVSFRSDYFMRSLLFSGLSFALVLGGLYAWLLFLSVLNRKIPSDEPMQRLVRVHLGWIERCPAPAKLFLPALTTMLAWGLGSPELVRLGLVPAPLSKGHLWEQALLFGVTSFLVWKLLLIILCALYLLNSYVYFGSAPWWRFINFTGANLLAPLRRLPLSIGKVDLAPVLGILLVLGAAHWAASWLPRLFQRLPL
jgi:uncharacterized protein YggT (Ycf19 family)